MDLPDEDGDPRPTAVEWQAEREAVERLKRDRARLLAALAAAKVAVPELESD